MARKRKSAASRDASMRRLMLASVLAAAGLGTGALLGVLAVGDGLRGGGSEAPSFAGLSSNPDALVSSADASTIPCPDCADSYGVGRRLREEHDRRMSEPFRELGAVDIDAPAPRLKADDEYRYGGRFPDPAPVPGGGPVPAMPVPRMIVPVELPDPAAGPTAKQKEGPGEPPEPSVPPQ